MFKVKPILPCPSIKEQVAFFESLGFKTIQIYTRPYPYAVVSYGAIELHFYGTKRILPNENPQMCYIEVDDVDRIHDEFTAGLKRQLGRIPRSGIPRISKPKPLAYDRRFIMTDVGGNTYYIGTPNAEPPFLRTIESEAYAGHFEMLYDLMYSKEDINAAFNMLSKFFPEDVHSTPVGDLDLAKILLVALDIHIQRNQAVDPQLNNSLKQLIHANDKDHPDWSKIANQYREIRGDEH